MFDSNVGIMNVVQSYYNCIKSGKMKLEDIPDRYRERVEIYYNEVEKSRAN